MVRFAASLGIALAAALLAARAGAQNLLTNGSFNTDISGWTSATFAGSGTFLFSTLDAGGSPSSGSVQLTNTSTDANRNVTETQCHAAAPGTSYDFGGKVRAPAGNASSDMYILLNFYPGAGCSGSSVGTFSRLDFDETGSWQGKEGTVVAPAGILSTSITLANFKGVAGSSTLAYFDDIFLKVSGTGRTTVTIPVAASIHGANNTFFHSDVWLFNRSFTSQNSVTLTYHCFGGGGCGAPQQVLLNPRQAKLIVDIIGTLFNAPETGGAIDLSWDSFNGSVTARSRLFTPTSPPSYGFGVPAMPAGSATSRAAFVGIAGSGASLASGFRSNAGAYNPNPVPVTVTFTLYDGSTGAQIGSPFIRVWAPFEAAQVSNLTASLGAPGVVTTNAVLVAVSSGGDVFFYAATVDNLSGDSFWITLGPDEPPVP